MHPASNVQGEQIEVIQKEDSGWWYGKLADSRMGWFPASFMAEP